MRKLFAILFLLIGIKGYSQLEIVNEDTLYFDNTVFLTEIDSVDYVNGYPRQEALHYIWFVNDNPLLKYKLKINRVTAKYLKKYIFDTLQLPVIKVSKDSAIKYPAFKQALENQVINKEWNVYLKNDNIWMFNLDEDKDTLYSMNNIYKLDSLGGKIWNWELFGVVGYAYMDEVVGGYTIRQICNSMDGIFKRKSNNQICVHLQRKNGEYPNWDDIKLLDVNHFTIATLPEFRNYYSTYDICEVDNVDEDVSTCTPITGY
jgi:hypothetical protein